VADWLSAPVPDAGEIPEFAPPDAGATVDATADAGAVETPADAAVSTPDAAPRPTATGADAGCACRTTSSGGPPATGLLLLATLALRPVRRRRSRGR
jgi:MYXO-CTERM domain-containing protein